MTLSDLASGQPLHDDDEESSSSSSLTDCIAWWNPSPLVVFLMGATCSGKGTFIDYHRAREDWQFVEVGKEFRRRYPPEYFQGSSNPEHTRREALQIYQEQFEKALSTHPRVIIVDGQPRTPDQVQPVIKVAHGFRRVFLLLEVPAPILIDRSNIRHQNEFGSPGHRLTISRITNDRIDLFHTMAKIIQRNETLRVVDAVGTVESIQERCDSLLWNFYLKP